MPKFEDLTIKEAAHEAAGADAGSMPEQFGGGGKPNLPEGRYTLQLPPNIAGLVEVQPHNDYGDRIRYNFGEDGLPAYNAAGVHVGQWYGRISAIPRNRAKTGDPKRLVSDLTYVAGAFGHQAKAVTLKPSGVVEFIAADTQKALHEIIVSHAEQYFSANNEWSGFCNPKNTRYISDGAGGSAEDPDGTKGCGTNVYSRDIPRVNGEAQQKFPCPKCGAVLLAYQNLGNFQPGPKSA